MKKQLAISSVIVALAIPLFGETKETKEPPEPTIDELKIEIYGLNGKVSMYKMELKSKDKEIKKLKARIAKLSSRKKKSNTSSYAKKRVQQKSSPANQQRERYKKLIAVNNAKLKSYFRQKKELLKSYNYAKKQYKYALQSVDRKRRKSKSRKWKVKVEKLKSRIQGFDKVINKLKQLNVRYRVYAK